VFIINKGFRKLTLKLFGKQDCRVHIFTSISNVQRIVSVSISWL